LPDPSACSGNPLDSLLPSSLHGLQSADWQLGPSYSAPQDNNHLIDTSSLLASSSASTGNLIVPDASLYPAADFNLFPTGDSPYLGHDFQLFPQGSASLPTAGDTIDTLAMAQNMKLSNNMDTAAHMTRGKSCFTMHSVTRV
jgi:hypothetical protein